MKIILTSCGLETGVIKNKFLELLDKKQRIKLSNLQAIVIENNKQYIID